MFVMPWHGMIDELQSEGSPFRRLHDDVETTLPPVDSVEQSGVLGVSSVALDSNHPDVATSLNNLAALYQTQGRYDDAEPLFKQALALGKRSWEMSILMSPQA